MSEKSPRGRQQLLTPSDMHPETDIQNHDLTFVKESLQTLIQELETSNEELTSSLEESQSTNEELQSLNEELTTVNAELENRIEQLSSTNEDIKNLLDNAEIATIVLGNDLCIKRFTAKATEIINLIHTDVGRPISHLSSNLKYYNLIDDVRTVLKTLEPITKEIVDKSGLWYVIRILPYRTVSGLIDGVIITFLNIQSQKPIESTLTKLESELETLKEFNQVLLSSISDSTLLLDGDANVILANSRFLAAFNLTTKDLIGQSIYKVNLGWNIPHLKNLIDEIIHGEALVSVSTLKTSPEGTCIHLTTHKLSSSILLLILS